MAIRWYDASTSGTQTDYYYLQDANYNVTAVTDTHGAVVERYAYSPYGKVTVLDANFAADADGVSDIGNTHFYTGRELDAETGLQLNRWRFYSPALGRWMTRDPIVYRGGSMSLYEYTGGRPVMSHDPLGMKSKPKLTSGTKFHDSNWQETGFPWMSFFLHIGDASPSDSSLAISSEVRGGAWKLIYAATGHARARVTISISCDDAGNIHYDPKGNTTQQDWVAQAAVAYDASAGGKTLTIHAVASGALSAAGGPKIPVHGVEVEWPDASFSNTFDMGIFTWECKEEDCSK